MQYIRISEGLNNYRLIPETENIQDIVSKNRDKDYYTSIYKYNEEQYQSWKATKSVAGIKNVTTNRIVLDFDNVDLEIARQDTITAVSRLTQKGIPQEAIQVAFSGRKGFSVEVDTDGSFSVDEFKRVTQALAGDLKSYDPVVSDPQRIFRVVGTKHQASGLYKIPLRINKLIELTGEQIKTMAIDINTVDTSVMEEWNKVTMPEAINTLKIAKVVEKENPFSTAITESLDLSLKPRWLTPAKFALQEGFFQSGERDVSLMILAATYRNQGFSKEIASRMLSGVAAVQAERNNSDPFSEHEIENNIIKQVYGPHWKGGQYSQDHEFLKSIAKRLNIPSDELYDKTYDPYFIHDIHDKFKDYVKNIDKNTIKTGIPTLDKNVFISTGCNLGIVGAPASGKSALALNILTNTSRAGIKSVFASFDMARTRMYEKILYKVTGLPREELYSKLIKDPEWADKTHTIIKEDFGNVFFFDKTASSVSDIKRYIISCNERAATPEDKVKLVMIDYFERVQSDISEDTAASKKVAAELQDLVNEFDIAQIVLLQPNKMSGDMSTPITSYTSVKGSSFLAQSFRIVLGIYREGFNPQSSSEDKYMTINTLKNDLGESSSMDFYWNGKRGEVNEIDSEGKRDLNNIRARQKPEEVQF